MSETNGTNGRRTSAGHGDGKRATRVEKENRIVWAMAMIIQGHAKSEIKRTFRATWNVGGYQTERYLRLARERLADDTGLTDEFTLEDMKVQHYAVAMSIVANSGDNKERIAALKHAGAIYGIGVPNRSAPTQPAVEKPKPYDNNAMEIALNELSIDELRVFKKLRDRIREIENGAANPSRVKSMHNRVVSR